MRRTHKSFPQDGEVWTAVCYGKITPNPEITSEHLIDLHFERKHQPIPGAKAKSQFCTAQIGIGALPGTALGTQWVNGKIIGDHPKLETRSGIVHFPNGTPSVISAYHQDEDEKPLIPAWLNPIPGEAASSPHISLPASGGFGENIIIPCAEVARAYFLRTTKLALTLMSDPIDRAIPHILDLNVPKKPGENPFCLREGFNDDDAVVASLLLYSSLFKSRASAFAIAQIAARRKSTASFLKVTPPIMGEGRVTALGYSFKVDGKKSFLALRLIEIPTPQFDVPTESIVRYLHQATELGEPSDNTGGGRPRGYHYVSPPEPNPQAGLGSAAEPNKAKPPRFLDPTIAEFENLPIFDVFIPPPLVRQPGSSTTSPDKPPEEYSTGAGVFSGKTGAVRFRKPDETQEVTESERKVEPAMPATFDSVEEVIPLLLARGCQVHSLSNNARTVGRATTVRYEMPRDDSNSNWACVGNHLRQMLVLEIEHEGDYFYLLDIQRRPESTESYTLFFVASALLSQPPLSRLSLAVLRELILESCVKNQGRWAVDGVTFIGSKLKHSHSSPLQLDVKLTVKMSDLRKLVGRVPSQVDGELKAA